MLSFLYHSSTCTNERQGQIQSIVRHLKTPLFTSLPITNTSRLAVIAAPAAASMLRSIAASITNGAATTEMNTLSALDASLGTGLQTSISHAFWGKARWTYNFANFENAVALGNVNCHPVRGGVGKDTRDGEGQSGDVEEGSLHFEGFCLLELLLKREKLVVISSKVGTTGSFYS